MSAPQALKDELLRLLDEAYDGDSVAISRVEVVSNAFLFYGEGEAPPMPERMTYKLVVDATRAETISLTIKPRLEPVVWPE